MSPDKPWIMEVKVRVKGVTWEEPAKFEWQAVCAIGNTEPYSYATELAAWRMLNMSYPDVPHSEKRVRKAL
jgi:hypothetical protein